MWHREKWNVLDGREVRDMLFDIMSMSCLVSFSFLFIFSLTPRKDWSCIVVRISRTWTKRNRSIEPFHVFEERFSHLVAVDSRAWPTSNKISFSDKEHEESQALTKASEIGENVFVSQITTCANCGRFVL